MKQLLFLLLIFTTISSAYGAETVYSDVTGDAFSRAVVKQIQELDKKREEDMENYYKSLRERYPDLAPKRRTYPSLKFYNQIFDTQLANTVFFAPGSSYISDVQKNKLDEMATAMLAVPEAYLVIEGHSTFNTQIEEREERLFYNRWISGRRAVQVYVYMVKRHELDPNRIAMFAYDSQRPLNGAETESEKAMNRRVELRLTNQAIPLGR